MDKLETKGRKRFSVEFVKADGDDEEDTGKVLAKFGTSGVKDLDGDVIEKGAIGVQQVQISAFGHTSWMGSLPVGKGVTREDGDAQLADLQFFMDTTHGRDHFLTVKALGELGEWSYGFDILQSREPTEDERQLGIRQVIQEMKVFEVSPVLRGAGIGTGTVEVKCDACALKVESAALEEAKAAAARGEGETEEKELDKAVANEFGKAFLAMAAVDQR